MLAFITPPSMIMKCPKCNSTRYTKGEKGWRCKRCGFVNDPNYLEKWKNKT